MLSGRNLICGMIQFLFIVEMMGQINNEGVDLSSFSTEYYSIPFIDLDQRLDIQSVVDKDPEQYLGHPTTHLLEDDHTLLVVYPEGHGRGSIVYKRSLDGGKSWSARLPTPASWASSLEVPTLFPVEDAAGVKRIIMFSGLYPARMAYSEDEGASWTELNPIGDWGGIVVMSDVIALSTGKGHYMAMFHDDGRFISKRGRANESSEQRANNQALFTLFATFSYDGGLSWSEPVSVFQSRIAHLCEPGLIRSPDGKQIAMLLRENSRRLNSHIMFSSDEGKTWSAPRELPNALTGDRHQAVYMNDGRLFISFRDNSPGLSRYHQFKQSCSNCSDEQLKKKAGPVSPTAGDWVAWVGTYSDLVEGKEGDLRIRLKDNFQGSDCAYPALEKMADGSIIATTYGHWDKDQPPYILCVRIDPEELK